MTLFVSSVPSGLSSLVLGEVVTDLLRARDRLAAAATTLDTIPKEHWYTAANWLDELAEHVFSARVRVIGQENAAAIAAAEALLDRLSERPGLDPGEGDT